MEILHLNGFMGEKFEIAGSENIKFGGLNGRNVYVLGDRPDLGTVIPIGWSGKTETNFVVINSSPPSFPPYWSRVVGVEPSAVSGKQDIYVHGNALRGMSHVGYSGEETKFSS